MFSRYPRFSELCIKLGVQTWFKPWEASKPFLNVQTAGRTRSESHIDHSHGAGAVRGLPG
jgi:hypothetical protein